MRLKLTSHKATSASGFLSQNQHFTTMPATNIPFDKAFQYAIKVCANLSQLQEV